MNKKLSYPKEKINVLLLENVDEVARKTFVEEGYNVETISSSLNEKELIEKIKKVSIIGIRSKTILNKKILSNAKRLLVIGAFCIGTNQIDLDFTKKKGIIVFNAPYSNTRSVVEIVIGQIILLIRNIVEKNNQMHKGIWKKNSNNSYEIRNKVLGIIGYGNIGSQLSTIAESIGMKVIYYDIKEKLSLGNAKKYKSLNQLIKASNILSIHVDGKKENTNLIGKNEFNIMNKGTILINYSKGFIIGFNVRALPHARDAAKRDGVDMKYYSIIYELIDDVKNLLSGLLTPDISEKITGNVEIREIFSISKIGNIAGCMVKEGIISRNSQIRLLRDNVVIHTGGLASLKRFKEEVKEVKSGFECGLMIENYSDIKIGDIIETFEEVKTDRKL